MRKLLTSLFLLLAFFCFAQTSELYRFKSGKPLSKAIKDPLNAVFVEEDNYTDSVFPNAAICQLKNVEHLIIKGRFCRQKKTDSLLAPLKIRIDTVALKQLKQLQYLEFSTFDFHEFPKEICAITQLKGLAIALCFVDSLPPEIARLKNLEILQVRLNNLTSLPASLATMDNLSEIDLANNRFVTIPQVLLKMKNLHSVIFSNVESDREYVCDYHWPFLIHINTIDYAGEIETLDSLLRLPGFEKIHLQVNSTAEKNSLLSLVHDDLLSEKISWRIAVMTKS